MRLGGDDPRPLGEALAALSEELGLPAGGAFTTLVTRWAEIVGAELAAHVTPEALRDGRLTVGAAGPIWASQFRYLETAVIERAEAVVGPGVVTEVRVRVVPG